MTGITIGIDMMGGDYAPHEAAQGVKRYLAESGPAVDLVLFGDEPALRSLLPADLLCSPHISIAHAPQVIGMHEHPLKALKEKSSSSIAVGYQWLAAGKTQAFISAGNTGAMLVAAMHSIGVIPGILRPAIGAVMPNAEGGAAILLDVGLNADSKPAHLDQFAMLGSLYARFMLGIQQPRTGLLNVGEEEGKGNILCQATYSLLKNNPELNFIGNIEGRDIFSGRADVMVTDGFTGNIILKMAESVYGISAAKKISDAFFDRLNFEYYGGIPVLGVAKPVIIGHGISTAIAFNNMIGVAKKMIATGLPEKIKNAFAAYPAA